MDKQWVLICDKYFGITKQAVNIFVKTLIGYFDYVLPVIEEKDVSEEILNNNNIFFIGCDNKNFRLFTEKDILSKPKYKEGYSIYVGDNIFNSQLQIVCIYGYDKQGVLYGCCDFLNKYVSNILDCGEDIRKGVYNNRPFDKKLPTCAYSSFPKAKTRTIWSWGHVIYDYKGFFENMAKLRLNEIVIWNDRVPKNANDVVRYAHLYGIKVIWGFSWGWETDCRKIISSLNKEKIEQLKKDIFNTYKEEYSSILGDGIYFQSFTELRSEKVGNIDIAEVVVEIVNDVADMIFEDKENIHIQFGLHATSVKSKCDIIKKVDPRIFIVWEDIGSFPFNYDPSLLSDFDDTKQFVQNIAALRSRDERFGVVMKGMLNLDWSKFKHFTKPYILGESSKEYIKNRQIIKDELWSKIQNNWVNNIEYLKKMIDTINEANKNAIFEMLIEDAMFEYEIKYPAALYAEMVWSTENRALINDEIKKYYCVY